MSRSISVFGTSHRLQGALKAKHVQHIDDPSYKKYLEDQIGAERFDFVFEEATEYGPTIAEKLINKFLGKSHYLDVDPRNRAKFGIPTLREDHTPINPNEKVNRDSVQHEDLEGQDKREELWVARIEAQPFTCALVICGYLHTLSLSFRLRLAGFFVEQTSVYMPFHKLA